MNTPPRALRAAALAVITLSLRALPAAAQSPSASVYLGFLTAGALSAEPGYAALPQAAVSLAAGVEIGRPWGLVAESAGLWLLPSAYSDMGYRYRGFMGGSLALGLRFPSAGTVEVSALAGAALARYALSDSYFFFPSFEARVSWPLCARGRDGGFRAGLSLFLFPRADALSAGLGARLSWSPPAAGHGGPP